MANSTSDNLKLTVQATGENSGTWGQITNTNLLILEQAIGGYSAVAVNATTGATLTFSNGGLSDGKNQVIKLTGTITGNIDVIIPDSVEKTYVIENGTTGAFTVTVKTTSGTGVTWGTTDKGTKMVYSDGTNVVDTAFTDLSSDTTPQLSANLDTNGNNILVDDTKGILDDSSNEQLIFSKTAAAVNNIQIKNAATSSAPEISAIGDDTNIDLTITPKGDGNVVLDGLKYPNADGSADQLLKTDGSGNLSFVDAAGGTSWQSDIKTTTFTAVAGEGYWVNTTGGAFTVTLPGSASVGDTIEFSDYLRTWGTNAVTLNTNSLNFQGNTSSPIYDTSGQSVTLVYSGATQGWIPTSDDDVTDQQNQPVTADFLVIAGGGGGARPTGGAGGAGGYRNSYNNETSGGGGISENSLQLTPGTTYTITVGAGGDGRDSGSAQGGLDGANGNDSAIFGPDITAIVSSGGGAGAGNGGSGNPGGSGGGGAGGASLGRDGTGTVLQGFNGGIGGSTSGGGGGGASEDGTDASGSSGGPGGDGLSSSITGSAVTRGGGGGGSGQDSGPVGSGGAGGGGDGVNGPTSGDPGTANTGGGGGGGHDNSGGNGGSGVVILRLPTARYSGTTTGSPTVGTDGTDTILTFTGSGSYTA